MLCVTTQRTCARTLSHPAKVESGAPPVRVNIPR